MVGIDRWPRDRRRRRRRRGGCCTPTWGAASPAPTASYMVSTMSSTSRPGRRRRSLDGLGHLLQHGVAVGADGVGGHGPSLRQPARRLTGDGASRSGPGYACAGRASDVRRRSGRPPPAAVPAGRVDRGQRVAQDGVVVGPDQEAVPVRGRHLDAPGPPPGPRRRPVPRDPAGGPGHRTAGGRGCSRTGTLGLRRGGPGRRARPRRSASWSGMRVWTSTRPPPSRAPDQPGRPGQQGQRLLARPRTAGPAGAGRCRGRPPASARSTRWSAASVPTTSRAPSTPASDPVAAGHLHGRRRRQGRQLLGGPGDPDAQRLQAGRVARGTHRRAALARTGRTSARPRTSGLGDRPRRSGCSGPASPQAGAGQQPDPAGPVEDAHHPAAGPVELRARAARPAARRTARCAGRRPVRSTTSTTGQPRRSAGAVGGHQRTALGQRPAGGTGDTSSTGAPSRRPRSSTTSTADQVGARSSR